MKGQKEREGREKGVKGKGGGWVKAQIFGSLVSPKQTQKILSGFTI